MESKKLVKVTVDGIEDTTVFEGEAALVVALTDTGEKIDATVSFSGSATRGNLAIAVANAINDIDNRYGGFLDKLMDELLLIQMRGIVEKIDKGRQ